MASRPPLIVMGAAPPGIFDLPLPAGHHARVPSRVHALCGPADEITQEEKLALRGSRIVRSVQRAGPEGSPFQMWPFCPEPYGQKRYRGEPAD